MALFNEYKGSTYTVAFDNDTQPYFYRSDLMEDPKEMAAFEDKYGRALRVPRDVGAAGRGGRVLHAQGREHAALRRRLDVRAVLVRGQLESALRVLAPTRTCMYFNEDGSANVDNEAGVRAFSELLQSLEWHGPGSLEKDWQAQYQIMGAGNGFAGSSFPNQTKLIPGNPDLDTASPAVGATIKSDVMPGRIVDGALIRRPVIFYNICYGVNAFADKSRHEAAYLFLQWAGGARVYTWLTFNPAGYQDPHHKYSFDDPYVKESYKPQPTEKFAEIVPRTAPPITIKGGGAYRDSLSEEIQKVLTKQNTPEQAAKALQGRWDKITDQQGVETQVEALKTFSKAFPTITDTPTA